MKKNNPLIKFKSSSSNFPEIVRDLYDEEAVYSKYNESPIRKTTAMFTLLKALMYTTRDSDDYFIGKTKDDKFIAELASSSRPGWVSVALYNPTDGSVKTLAIEKDTHQTKFYQVENDKETSSLSEEDFFVADGTVIWLALLPTIFKDDEAVESSANFIEAYNIVSKGDLSALETANKAAGTFSDNVYIRVTGGLDASDKEEKRQAHIKLYNGTQPGKLMANNLLNKQAYTEVLYGKPSFIKQASTKRARKIKPNEFNLGIKLTDKQKSMIPVMPAGYVTTKTTIKMCETVMRTRGTNFPVKDFLLEGPAGTGKTSSAEDFALQLGLPFRCFTCSSGTTEDQIFGGIYPNPSSLSKKSPEELNNIPTSLEIEFDPAGSYKQLTGEEKPDITAEEVFKCANMKLRELAKEGSVSSSGISYDYYPSTIVEILKNGGVIEIQEPGAIASASTLSCLNDILSKSDGIISTPYGPIKRHPECYIIATNNPDSNVGYGKLNEAVRNRFDRTYIIDLPTVDELVERALQKGLMKDEIKCRNMAAVIQDLDVCIRENGIQGEAGQRCFFAWCQDVDAGVEIREALADCVINNVTSNKDEQDLLYGVVKANSTLLNEVS